MTHIFSLILIVSGLSLHTAARQPSGWSGIQTGAYADSLEPVLALPVILPAGYTMGDMGSEPKSMLHLPDFTLTKALEAGVAVHGSLGRSKQGKSVEAFYFPGTGGKRAIVVGGVHGSELSSIELAKTLVSRLQEEQPYYSVLVIPCLFPDNAALAEKEPALIGSVMNRGRYTNDNAVDPNRQMPALGQAFNPAAPLDFLGRRIEWENTLLLDLIRRFRPDRIINIHAIRDIQKAGIYADPRTDHQGCALGFDTDSSLAIEMAAYIQRNGGLVPGNRLDSTATAVYHSDPPVSLKSEWQKRNVHGSHLPGDRGHGVSLGSWASTAVFDPLNTENNRKAIRLFTMEFPGCKRPADYTEVWEQYRCRLQVDLYASAILAFFLGRYYEE